MAVYRNKIRFRRRENTLLFSKHKKDGKWDVLGGHGLRIGCRQNEWPILCTRIPVPHNNPIINHLDYTQAIKDKYAIETIEDLKEATFPYIKDNNQYTITIHRLTRGFVVELIEYTGVRWLYLPPEIANWGKR